MLKDIFFVILKKKKKDTSGAEPTIRLRLKSQMFVWYRSGHRDALEAEALVSINGIFIDQKIYLELGCISNMFCKEHHDSANM